MTPQHPLSIVGLFLSVFLISSGAVADWTEARCDIFPIGGDYASASIPCTFSQRQGFINIDRSDGINHALSPQDDSLGHYKDERNKDVYRQSGMGKGGLIFRFSNESIFLYWDTTGLPGNDTTENYTAPYTTPQFDATARLPCKFQEKLMSDCPMGVNRGPKLGETVITIMRPDGIERVVRFDGNRFISSGIDEIHVRQQPGLWIITIDGDETYRIPVAVIEGG